LEKPEVAADSLVKNVYATLVNISRVCGAAAAVRFCAACVLTYVAADRAIGMLAALAIIGSAATKRWR